MRERWQEEVHPAAAPTAKAHASGNVPWRVERNGINIIPEEERTGRPNDLFWLWFAANIGILAVVLGGMVMGFGLNLLQGLLVAVLGAASFLLVGVLSLAGRDGGAPMLTLSRAVFGVYGNIAPTLISWVSLVGWETVTVITATLALMALLHLFLALPTVPLVLLSLAVVLGLSVAAGLLGQATLVVVETFASYAFGALTLLVVALLIPGTDWHALLTRPPGPWLSGFVPALTIVIAGTGLSWANTAADYSRYLPRRTPAAAIVLRTTLGSAIPLVVLMATGMLVSARAPSLATSPNPIGVLLHVLPRWASVPYLVAAVGGLVAQADLGLYSSGLNLLNLFVPLPRHKTVVLDALLMVAGTVYVILIAQDFFGPFESFLVLLGIGIAAWAGVFLTDQLTRRKGSYPPHLLYDPTASDGAIVRGVNRLALAAWALGLLIGLLSANSPFYRGPLAGGIVGESSLAILFAFATAGLVYGLGGRFGGRT